MFSWNLLHLFLMISLQDPHAVSLRSAAMLSMSALSISNSSLVIIFILSIWIFRANRLRSLMLGNLMIRIIKLKFNAKTSQTNEGLLVFLSDNEQDNLCKSHLLSVIPGSSFTIFLSIAKPKKVLRFRY